MNKAPFGTVVAGTGFANRTQFTGYVKLKQPIPMGTRLFCSLGLVGPDGLSFNFIESNQIDV